MEEDEYFLVQVSAGIEAINVPANSTARVTIIDDDGMLYSYTKSELSKWSLPSSSLLSLSLSLSLSLYHTHTYKLHCIQS